MTTSATVSGTVAGVPFTWTLRLAAPWALVNGVLLTLFTIFDRVIVAREKRKPRRRSSTAPRGTSPVEPLHLDGAINLLWLLGIVAVVFIMGTYGKPLFGDSYLRSAVQILGMVGLRRPVAGHDQTRDPRGQSLQLGADHRGRGGLHRRLRHHDPGPGIPR